MNRREFRLSLVSFLVFTAIAVTWAVFLFAKGGAFSVGGPEAYKVRALLPTSATLAPGARVTMAGVEVGEVEAVKRAGLGARVDLSITAQRVIPLPADSRIRVRQLSPIGENYVSIVPGDAAAKLESGGTLAIDQADEYVDVDQVLSTLRGKTRDRARQTIQSLGGALEGRGTEFNDMLRHTLDAATNGARVVDVLHRDREAAGQLIEQLGDLATDVGTRGDAIRTLAQRGLVGLDAVRDGDADLAAGLRQLPEVLSRTRTTVLNAADVSRRATPVAFDLGHALQDVRPAVQRLPAAARAGEGILQSLAAAAPGLEDTLTGATALSGVLPAALPRIRKTFCQLNPMVRYTAPYAEPGLHILIGLGSASNSYDATGHLIRLSPIFSDNSLSGLPDEVQQAGLDVLHSGLIGAPNGLNYNPYPKPSEMGSSSAVGGFPAGPEQVPETGYKYPRIKADC